MKKMKGFTLLELIIVMAILTILMTAVIRMFRPIRETYVDATLIESQRTVQNGMTKYVTESIRFATDLGLYTEVSNAADAVDKFAAAYMTANGIDPTSADGVAAKIAITKYAEVIIVDHGAYPYMGGSYNGRLLRRKVATAYSSDDLSTVPEPNGTNINADKVRDNWRIAMGAAYYGTQSYTVAIKDGDATNADWGTSDGINVLVSSKTENNMRPNWDSPLVKNNSLVVCKNLPLKNATFDTSKFNESNSTAAGTKVYIVFLNEKV